MTGFTLVSWLLLTPLAIVTTVFLVEMASGLWPSRRRPSRKHAVPGPLPATTIMIPAHDEADGIVRTLESLASAREAGMNILVVADNCSDNTADVARRHGANVIERHDPGHGGKGYALDFGRAHLQAGSSEYLPECVIVLDADCRAETGALDAIARAAIQRQRPVQASYLLNADLSGSPMVQISNFAFLVKNLVRQKGLSRIGAPVMLTGSGMAFPWTLFAKAPLASGEIVEDLAIGIALSRQGAPPIFASMATIWSDPSVEHGTLTQRTRWENGFVAMARTEAIPLLLTGLRTGRGALIWLALHLMVPPLALLMIANAGLLILLTLLALAGAGSMALITQAVLMLLVGLTVLLAWVGYGRSQMPFGTILRIPLYIVWKLPVYRKLASGGERRWIRTERK